jgi:adenylate cyclase
MPHQVIIAQFDSTLTQVLFNLFAEQGYQGRPAATAAEMLTFIKQEAPELVVVDLHLTTINDWPSALNQLKLQFPQTKLLFTTSYPDPAQELQAKEQYGARAFLQTPFTRTELELALQKLKTEPTSSQVIPAALPKIRIPVRVKITLPYVLLALALAIAAAFIVSRVVLDTIEERFTNQLIEAGKITNDWMVQQEDKLLETLRLLTYTQGLPEAVATGKAEDLRELALPVAVNNQIEVIEILNTQGVSLLSLRHLAGDEPEKYSATRGETIFKQWSFVQKVLEHHSDNGRDKYAGIAQTSWGDYLYIAGPIVDNQGSLVGVMLIGESLRTLVQQARQNTLAHTIIYDFNGRAIASTLPFLPDDSHTLPPELVSSVLERQDEASMIRPLAIASIGYSEIIGPWEVGEVVRVSDQTRSNNDLGVLGVALAETFLARPSQITRLQIFLLTTVAFLLVIGLGVYVANRITYPLLRVVNASAEVAQGNLEVQVEAAGNDEVAVLAHSFNQMVTGLREGSIYRDLLGRTVSPEVREELRRGFASGEVRLQGQETVATVLMSDIRGFTRLSETEDPTTILTWLNEFFGELVPIVIAHGGVVNSIEGDTLMAFFGVLPRLLPAQEGAYQACQAALDMLQAIEQINTRRTHRQAPAFSVGISINTGPVTAGSLGSHERLHYTVIGDTVNTTTLLQSLTRQFGEESSAILSQHTLFALRERRHEFQLESLGAHTFRGKAEQLLVYHLQPPRVRV